MPEISEEELTAFKGLEGKLTDLTTNFDDISGQFKAVKGKNEELLSEAKKAKNARREAEELARLETEAKHKASNNFEELHKSSELERDKLLGELTGLKDGIADEKRNAAATKLAAELAEGVNVGLLAEFVTKRLRFAEGEVKVLDKSGQLTVSTIDDLKKEIQGDERFISLLKGNQSSGGSANGGNNSGSAAKEITRAEFDALDHPERSEFFKAKGKVID